MSKAMTEPGRIAFAVFLAVAVIGVGISWSIAQRQQAQTQVQLMSDMLRASDQVGLLSARLRLAAQSLAQGIDLQSPTVDGIDYAMTEVEGFRTALVLSPEGVVLDDSRDTKPALGVDVADRTYVTVHQVPGSQFFSGEPVSSRVDGAWSLPASLPLRLPSGELRGIAVISVGSEYFASVWQIISEDGAALFLRRQGQEQFFPLGHEQPSHLLDDLVVDDLHSNDHEYAGAQHAHTQRGDVFFYSPAYGDFELAMLLPQAHISATFNRWFIGLSAAGLVCGLVMAALTGGFAHSWQMTRQQLKKTLRLEERLRLATSAAGVGIWDMNLNSGVLSWDETMHELYGVPASDFQGAYEDWRQHVHPDDIEGAEAEFNRCIETGESFVTRFRILADEKVRHIQAKASVIKDGSGLPPRMIGANFDVTMQVDREAKLEEAKRAAEQTHAQMARDALHDALTGLLNRRGLEQAIKKTIPSTDEATLILIDLDRFKLVNDSFGHQAGDAVLRAVANRLRRQQEPGDIVARVGGDEFVVVRPGADPQATEEWAQDTIWTLAEPVDFEERVCRFGVSMGAAHGSIAALRSDDLVRCADHALYQAKKDGRGQFRYFTEQLSQSLANRKALTNDLEHAIDNDAFSMVYMPKFEVATRNLIGLEALLRWDHPVHGVLTPDAFLDIAEAIKLTGQIDSQVLDLVLRDREQWEQNGFIPPSVSVNVSTSRLKDPELVKTVMAKGLPRGAISLELLESVFLDDIPTDVTASLDVLRSLGVGIEIDDFGSGHASILAVPKIGPDFIKVDRALVKDIDISEPARRTVSSIIEMASSYGVRVIAEGVETQEQLAILKSLGCFGSQGFLFGRPLAARDVNEILEESRVA